MSDSITTNNLAVISGQITRNFRPCPGNPGKNVCMTDLAVKRLSGCIDYIPVTIRTDTADTMHNRIEQNIRITGRISSYNYHSSDGSHLNISLLAHTHVFLDNPDNNNNENSVFLDGYISRIPVFRTTPLGRRITELTIAVNYPYMESDYIPCICWNKTALETSILPCGTHMLAWGRMQSREYLKKINELEICQRTAYEVSIKRIFLPDKHNSGGQ